MLARLGLNLALAMALAAMLQAGPTMFLPIGLFVLTGLVQWLLSRFLHKTSIRIIMVLILAGSLALFFSGAALIIQQEERRVIQLINYGLIGSAFVALFLIPRTEADLCKLSTLVVALFFFSATYADSVVFLPALLISIGALFAAFFANRRSRPSESGEEHRYWLFAAGLAGVTLAVGWGIFLLFPRAWFFRPPEISTAQIKSTTRKSLLYSTPGAQMGFDARGNVLQLTNFYDLARSFGEVLNLRMNVMGTGQPFVAMDGAYLRARVFDQYTNGGWVNSGRMELRQDNQDGRMDGWTTTAPGMRPADYQRIRQNIRQIPLEDVCVCLPEPERIRSYRILTDGQGLLSFPTRAQMEREYEIISDVPVQSPDSFLGRASPFIPEDRFKPFLHVPAEVRSLLERMNQQFQGIAPPGAKILSLRRFLQTSFSYSLESFMVQDGWDPVSEFLIRKKSGYCTHFASAMTLMARSLGVPARLVTGFHFGGMPGSDNRYYIRDYNAHAWTEVFFPELGWVIVDATPSGNRPSMPKGLEGRGLNLVLSLLSNWREKLVEFDRTTQGQWLREGKQLVNQSLGLASHWFRNWPAWIAVGMLAICAWIFARSGFRNAFPGWLARREVASSVQFYSAMLAILARHGLRKKAASTGWEFLHDISLSGTPLPEVDRLTSLFYRIKYGGRAPSSGELAEARTLLEGLRTRIRSLKP